VPPTAGELLAYLLRRQERNDPNFWGEKLAESGGTTPEELSLTSDLNLRKAKRKVLISKALREKFDQKIIFDVQQILRFAGTELTYGFLAPFCFPTRLCNSIN
jgi:hypothetical protein